MGESVSAHPLRTVSVIAIVWWVSWMQVPLAFESRYFPGLIFHLQVLKVGVPGVQTSSLLKEQLRVVEFPPNCGLLCQGWGFGQDFVSGSPTCFSVHLFLFAQFMGHLVLRFLSEEIIL